MRIEGLVASHRAHHDHDLERIVEVGILENRGSACKVAMGGHEIAHKPARGLTTLSGELEEDRPIVEDGVHASGLRHRNRSVKHTRSWWQWEPQLGAAV